MAVTWSTGSAKFAPFEPLKSPLESVLTILETVEAVLEALLDLIKAFLIDISNPITAAILLLLAAVRTIINQIKSSGFSLLLIHPDFNRQDFADVIQSVSGSYPSFESKVISKFYDTSDIFRPQYGKGSSVGIAIIYIGTETPGDLLLQIFSLIQLFRTPVILGGLPAPVNVRVNPAKKSGSPVVQFKSLFDSDLDKGLSIEWEMPMNPGNSSVPGFLNSLTSFYNKFRFPNFLIERSTSPNGETVEVEVKTQTVGGPTNDIAEKYGLIKPISKIAVRDETGDDFKNFEKKIPVSSSDLVAGALTSTYRYFDNDPELESGKPYYYRVRAYFGNPAQYINTTDANSILDKKSSLIFYDTNQPIIRYGAAGKVVMGPVSPVVRGFVPRISTADSPTYFNPYESLYDAVKAAVLLNFELQPLGMTYSGVNDQGIAVGANYFQKDQMAGWGTIAAAAGQISLVKAYVKDSEELKDNLIFKTTCRRISNQSVTNLYSNPRLMDLLFKKWNSGVSTTVTKVLEADSSWTFPNVSGGYNLKNQNGIYEYLNKELDYKDDDSGKFSGPFPVKPGDIRVAISADERRDLAEFLRMALSSLSGSTSYLSWYSVTIGDIFPAFVPFIFDFEQWLNSLLKALESAVKAITDIIETLLSMIRQLESIIQIIVNIIDLMSVEFKASVMFYSTTNGSSDDLVQAIIGSQEKPFTSPYGLHSGLVLAFGGPGEGSLAALKAIQFLLNFSSSKAG